MDRKRTFADEVDVDQEIARNLWKQKRMIPPGSRFRHYWDYVIVVLVLYNCVLTPLQLGYCSGPIFRDAEASLFIVDILMWLFFVADMFVNLRTSFYDEDHQIVVSVKEVAERYRQGWLVYDVIATVPYHIVGFVATLNAPTHRTRVFAERCSKIPFCLRIFRLYHKLEDISSQGYFRVVLQMLVLFLFAHWVACVWWLIGEGSYATSLAALDGGGDVADSSGTSWLLRVPAGSTPLATNVTTTPFAQQYMSSLYWSLTTLMKTPWVGPDTVLEKVFSSMMVVLGATMFAVLLGNVTAMINTYNKRHSELRDRLTTLHMFATFRRVPTNLQRKMFAYIDAYWNMTSGLDQSEVLHSLPPRLRGSVLSAIHGPLLKECPLLRACSVECAKTLLLKAQPQVTLQKEEVLIPGQLCAELFVLITGSLQITLPGEDGTADRYEAEDQRRTGRGASMAPSGAPARAFSSRAPSSAADAAEPRSSPEKLKGDRLRFRVVEKPGQIFGLSEPFRQPTTYPFRVTALKTSQMIYISRADLADVLSVFPGADADAVCHVLRSDFAMCWETLKPRAGAPTPAPADAVLELRQARELGELREKVAAFEPSRGPKLQFS